MFASLLASQNSGAELKIICISSSVDPKDRVSILLKVVMTYFYWLNLILVVISILDPQWENYGERELRSQRII